MKDDNEEVLTVLQAGLQRLDIHLDNQESVSFDQCIHLIINHLSARISDWLEHDFTHLTNLMYRIDVGEHAFTEALASQNPSKRLAELVLQRELQKARTRIAYRKTKENEHY